MKLRRQTKIGELGFLETPLDDFKFYGGKSGSGSTVYVPEQTTPTYYTPPTAPKADEEATLELADEEDETALQKKALKQGARSLRIPLGTGL